MAELDSGALSLQPDIGGAKPASAWGGNSKLYPMELNLDSLAEIGPISSQA